MWNSECLKQCPFGTYGDSITRICKPCSVTCLGCSGPTNNDCINCNIAQGYMQIVNNPLVCGIASCTQGTFRKETEEGSKCFPCHKSCLNCKGGERKDCTECKAGFIQTPNLFTGDLLCLSGEESTPGT